MYCHKIPIFLRIRDLILYISDLEQEKKFTIQSSNNYRLLQTDIDECTRTLHNCYHPNVTCVNTVGSFSCTCKPGFEGDGITICEGKELTNIISKANFIHSKLISPFSQG